jgi:hypothetical protein
VDAARGRGALRSAVFCPTLLSPALFHAALFRPAVFSATLFSAADLGPTELGHGAGAPRYDTRPLDRRSGATGVGAVDTVARSRRMEPDSRAVWGPVGRQSGRASRPVGKRPRSEGGRVERDARFSACHSLESLPGAGRLVGRRRRSGGAGIERLARPGAVLLRATV